MYHLLILNMSEPIQTVLSFPGFVGKPLAVHPIQLQHYHSYERSLVHYPFGGEFASARDKYLEHIGLLKTGLRVESMRGCAFYGARLVARTFPGSGIHYYFRAHLRQALAYDDPLILYDEPPVEFSPAVILAAVEGLHGSILSNPLHYSVAGIRPVDYEFVLSSDSARLIGYFQTDRPPFSIDTFDTYPESHFGLPNLPLSELAVLPSLDRLCLTYLFR